MLISPCEAACEELLLYELDRKPVVSGYLDSEAAVSEMWEIDKQAYQDCSLGLESFLAWWRRYEFGSRVLRLDGEIVAGIGIYPLYPEQAEKFANGEIPESKLLPVTQKRCDRVPVKDWYVSGVVIKPEHQNRGLLRTLLRLGLGAWDATGHVSYPARMLGLAEYTIGQKLLAKFGFTKHRDGQDMPDGCDLYLNHLESSSQWLSLLKSRGL